MVQKLDKRNGKYSFRYFDIDGHFRRYTCTSLSKKEAEYEQLQFLSDLKKSKKNHTGKYDIDTLLWQHFTKLYLEYCTNHKATNSNDYGVIKVINRLFPDLKYLKDFDREKIEKFRTLRKSEVSLASINRNMHCIKSMWSFAVNDLELDCKNQAKGISDFPVPIARKIEYFTIDEIKQMLTQTNIPDLKTLYYLMLSFGLRLKEAATIKWEDINFRTNRILIHPYKTFKHNPQPVSLTMPNNLIQYLNSLNKKGVYVIGKEIKTQEQLRNLSQRIKKHLKHLIGHGSAHICRHTYITHAVNNPNIAERDIMKTARINNHKIIEAYGHYTIEREKTIANEVYNVNYKKELSIEEIDRQIEELQELKRSIISKGITQNLPK
ncbi:MAG: site-specific integrase [Elusimicrobia bacterium]|nr:site-specific integrase [Elusimicrobiota bacterium]